MFIEELALKNFRNYKNLFIEFSPGINLIIGPNAAGKTNILESVSVVSNLRSFRNVPDFEIIRWGEDSYFCSLTLGGSSFTKFEIGSSFLAGKIQKKAKIDGIIKKRISDYYGKFLTVFFSPEDVALITGPPDIRRKLFDAVISKVDADYLISLSDFKKILASRNKLLRDIRERKKSKPSELDVWDDMFARRASIILKKRIEFLNIFNPSFRDSVFFISENADFPYIDYNSTFSSCGKENIIEELIKHRDKDIYAGSTALGPHRDDYVFLFEGNNKIFKNCASQGQKRTAAVSLKMAECKFIEQETNKKAVILIDDIFGDLDEKRRNRMLDVIKDGNQVIITAVNSDLIQRDIFIDIQKFLVLSGGNIERL